MYHVTLLVWILFFGVFCSKTYGQSATDQHGNVVPLDSLKWPTATELATRGSGGGAFCLNSGIFNVYFRDVDLSTGTGFDDAIEGAARRDVVCRAFADLSLLLDPADDPYNNAPNLNPFVRIFIGSENLGGSALAGAAAWNNTIALPDGDGCPINEVTQSAQREGILDCEVWRTINGGRDSWEAFALAENNCALYEHGRILFDFVNHSYYTGATGSVTGNDLYSVAAHEAMHLLGFYSLTGSTGSSDFEGLADPSKYFSRFDRFLNDGAQNLIIDSEACDWTNNTNALDVTNPCNVFFEGPTTTVPQVIYSPLFWAIGSSLSHLDNACGGSYLMHWQTIPNTRKIPSSVEVGILCDIGYHTTTAYGDALSGWDDTYATFQSCGTRLAGVDDIFDDPMARTFNTMVQGNAIVMANFLDNDEDESTISGDPPTYDCLTILQGGGSFTSTVTTFTYTPDPDFVGWSILRYVPRNNVQDRNGNFTYVYIEVRPRSICEDQVCNIVNGGDFENSVFSTVENAPYYNWRIECGQSPDLIIYDQGSSMWVSENSFGGVWPWDDYYGNCPSTTPYTVVLPPSHNGSALNEQYMAMIGTGSGSPSPYSENLMFELCRPLIPGNTYTLNYWIYGNGTCGHGVAFAATEFRPCNQAQDATDVTGGLNSCSGNSFPAHDVFPPTVAALGWNNVTSTFIFNGADPTNWLLCYQANPGGGTYQFGPIFIDDVQIHPSITISSSVTPECNGMNDGSIVLAVNYYPGSYDVQWLHGPTTEDLFNLAPGTYTVTITDTELGCASHTESFVIEAAVCAGPLTLTKTINTTNTYAGAPVLYTITMCNNNSTPESVVLTDMGLYDPLDPLNPWFIATSSTPPWPGFPVDPLTVNVPGNGCYTVEIAGHFNAIGVEPYVNCVTATPTVGNPLTACAEPVIVQQNCPLAVSGTGDCAGPYVSMCMSVHSLITNIGAIEFDWVYPAFLVPPTQAALMGALTPPSGATFSNPTISGALAAPAPYDLINGVPYNMVHVRLLFSLPFSTLGQNRMFCMQFGLPTGSVPLGMNTFQTMVIGSNGDHRTDLYESDGTTEIHPGAGFLTQAANIILTACPGDPGSGLDASFVVEAPSCGGEVHVEANTTTTGAIHMWTWGDERTTPINGALSYTYDYFEPISMTTEWPVNPPIPPADPGTYTITHTVILNGVASTSTQFVTLYTCCEASVIVPDGTLASGGIDGFFSTADIQGEYIVDVDVVVYGAHLYMEPGSEIIVRSGSILDIRDATIESCNNVMWRGITVEAGGTLYISRSYVDDAENVITALDGSVVTLKETQFHNNRVTVYVPALPGVVQNNVSILCLYNQFYSAGEMPLPYPGQTTAIGEVGYAAFDIQRVPLMLTDGWNLFHHLSNGIVADRCDITLHDCSFQYVEPDAAYALIGNGSAVNGQASKGWNTLKQVGSFVNGQVPFRECRWAVYTNRMNVYSNANTMQQVGTAYHVEKSGSRTVHIWDNTLDTKYGAMELFFNDEAAQLLVENNDITFGNELPGLTALFTAIRVEEGNGVNPNSVIRNNTINYRSGVTNARTGIQLQAASNYLVAGNEMNMTDNSSNYAGVSMSGCYDTEVSCNTVNGALNGYPAKGQAAIRNFKGGRPFISCNDMDHTTNGMVFSGESYGADVRGNHIRNHKWGLHLDGTAIIDAQQLKGNLWYNSPAPGGMEAWYEVTNLQSVLSQFRVDPITLGTGVTWPPNWSPLNWFQPYTGFTYDCANDHNADYCEEYGREKCEKCLNDLDEKISNDSLENDPYTEETKWTLKGDLYKKLDNAPELLDSLPDLATFYAAMQYEVIAQLKGIEDERNNLANVDSTVRANLEGNNQQMQDLLVLLKTSMAQLDDSTLTSTQRQALSATIASYQLNIRSLAEYNTAAMELARTSKVLSAENVKAVNAALSTSELIEQNAKAVNEVYLATIGKEEDTFTSGQTGALLAIANQCPMVGGNAVFRARALYALINGTQDYDDEMLCLQHGIILKSRHPTAAATLNVIPNPTNNEATLVLEQMLDEPGVFVVFDALGSEVLRYSVPIETLRFRMNTVSLAPALYHYQVRGPSGLLGVGKLTIVR